MSETASRYLAQPTPSFWKSLRYLSDARLTVAALLLAYVPLLGRDVVLDPSFDGQLFLRVAAVYFSIAAACSVIVRLAQRGFHLQLLSQILVDIVAIGIIIYAAGGARSGLGVLMITPTAGAAVLSTPLLSMFIAASASLVLLAESLWRRLMIDAYGQAGSDGGLFIAAVISATLFITVVIVNRLARRLTDQERLASRRGQDLRNQLAINELVIAELDQGVVVFNRRGGISGMNPKARMLLGLQGEATFDAADQATLAALRRLITGEQLVTELGVGPEGERKTKIRARVLTGAGGGEASAARSALVDKVVLLEDLEHLEERAQQLKLAAMGRLSASIAHEIRNPLGAIRHAGNLLAEQVPEGSLRRLTTIIEANSLRIDRIVEDVLSIARRSATREEVHLPQFFNAFLPEFVAQVDTSWERISLRLESATSMLFDPNQLRQVLVNLLSNALRYATDTPGAILISWQDAGAGRALLRVVDDGPGIAPSARRHLFEPFFTTEARGTGLGLHMAQELCAANGAHLRYEPRSGERYGGGFIIEPEVAAGPAVARVDGTQEDAGPAPEGSQWQQKQTV
jgi:two-component system sensor histidine kinase PilS (NtrC family)